MKSPSGFSHFFYDFHCNKHLLLTCKSKAILIIPHCLDNRLPCMECITGWRPILLSRVLVTEAKGCINRAARDHALICCFPLSHEEWKMIKIRYVKIKSRLKPITVFLAYGMCSGGGFALPSFPHPLRGPRCNRQACRQNRHNSLKSSGRQSNVLPRPRGWGRLFSVATGV